MCFSLKPKLSGLKQIQCEKVNVCECVWCMYVSVFCLSFVFVCPWIGVCFCVSLYVCVSVCRVCMKEIKSRKI